MKVPHSPHTDGGMRKSLRLSSMSISSPSGVEALRKNDVAEILTRGSGFVLVIGDLVVPDAVGSESVLDRHSGLVGAYDVVPGSVAGADEVIGCDGLAGVIDSFAGVDELLALLGPVLDSIAQACDLCSAARRGAVTCVVGLPSA